MSAFDFTGIEREEAVIVDMAGVTSVAAYLKCPVYNSLGVYDNVVTIGTVGYISH